MDRRKHAWTAGWHDGSLPHDATPDSVIRLNDGAACTHPTPAECGLSTDAGLASIAQASDFGDAVFIDIDGEMLFGERTVASAVVPSVRIRRWRRVSRRHELERRDRGRRGRFHASRGALARAWKQFATPQSDVAFTAPREEHKFRPISPRYASCLLDDAGRSE
jgi:hypothetical protein